jgi:hypothetical protein
MSPANPVTSFLSLLSPTQLLDIFGTSDLGTLMKRPTITVEVSHNVQIATVPPLDGVFSDIVCHPSGNGCAFCPSPFSTFKIVVSRRGLICSVNDAPVGIGEYPKLDNFVDAYDEGLIGLVYGLRDSLRSKAFELQGLRHLPQLTSS